MAVINFPDNPSDGDTQDVGGITYTYSSSKGYWTAAASGGAGGGGASVTTDDVAPSSPSDGDLWYDTDDGGMFVYYEDTDSSQWVEVIGSAGADGAAGATGPAGADGSAAVYATVDDLPGTASAGDQAFVTASNRLYLWNGSGWYNIALINTTPSISGAASSYTLAIDGTATTVTITATDPEGLPITYSIASDTSGNIATVSQGTGSNTNVFTITPSTNAANAGTFSLTFRASDGVNIASAISSFTLQFSVENQNYTTGLITSVGANNAVNNSFIDSSTNNHTITAAGNATQTTFSPYRHGGYSTRFVGSEYLKTNSSISLANDFTMEFWVYRVGSGNDYMVCVGNTNSTSGMEVYIGANGGQFNFYHNGAWRIYSTSSIPAVNEWSHIAVVRDSGTITMYLNGTSLGTYSMTDTISGEVYVNAELYNSNVAVGGDGYMRDVRIVDGTAIYTSNFTPPTEKLTEVSGTEVLLCNLPYIADSSSNGLALTITGTPETQPFTPYDAQQYSASSHLGSMYFDGSGDYITAPAASIARGTDDYTIETWVYYTSLPATAQIWDTRTAAQPIDDFLTVQTDGSLRWRNNGIHTTPAGTVPLNTWTHLAQCRSSGTVKTYVNGVEKASHTNTANLSHGANLDIGGSSVDNSQWSNGNFADFRVVLGTAVYTSAFTPPTVPLTAITNTSLLVQGTNAGIIDKSQSVKSLTLNGDVKSSTTQTKYLSSSMYFDGTGDYIVTDGIELGSSNFTVEFWMRGSDVNPGGNFRIIEQPSGSFAVDIGSGGKIRAHYNGGNFKTDTGAVTQDTWHHVAVVREGTGTDESKIYIDGTLLATGTLADNYTDTNFEIGGNSSYFTGFLSDIRITKGLARYTTNFTPPTAALQG